MWCFLLIRSRPGQKDIKFLRHQISKHFFVGGGGYLVLIIIKKGGFKMDEMSYSPLSYPMQMHLIWSGSARETEYKYYF